MSDPDGFDARLESLVGPTLDALLDAAPVGVLILDRDLRYVRANRRLTGPAGLRHEDYVGRHPSELRPDLAPRLMPSAQHVLDTGESVDGILLSGSDVPTGTKGHWLTSFHPVRDDDGVVAVCMLLTDVTDQLERTRVLERNRELLSETERLVGVGSWSWDVDQHWVELTEEARRIFDLGSAGDLEWPVDEVLERFPPESHETLVAAASAALDAGSSFECEYRFVRRDGSVRWIREKGQVVRADDGRVTRMRGTIQDVTAQHEVEQRVALWTLVSDQLPVGVAVLRLDVDGPRPMARVVAANAAVRGTGVEEGMDLDLTDVADRLGRHLSIDGLLQAGRTAMEEQEAVDAGEIVLPDGRRLVLQAFPVSEPGEVGLLLEDVTERRRLQHERVELLQRSVFAADAERRRIAGRLHDEAIQLLAAGMLRLDKARLEHPEVAGLANVREVVDAAVDSLRDTILEVSPGDLVEEGLPAALDSYAQRLLHDDDIEVDLEVDLNGSLVPDQVMATAYQVLQEALANVRRHAEAGRVVVRVGLEEELLVGEVVDDGVGIDVGDGRRVDSFGLRLMRERVELLGGTVAIEPRLGASGTQVRFQLPLG